MSDLAACHRPLLSVSIRVHLWFQLPFLRFDSTVQPAKHTKDELIREWILSTRWVSALILQTFFL